MVVILLTVLTFSLVFIMLLIVWLHLRLSNLEVQLDGTLEALGLLDSILSDLNHQSYITRLEVMNVRQFIQHLDRITHEL